MNTSYFARSANHPNDISIAQGTPKWFYGKQYNKLAPDWFYIMKYKKDGDWNYYVEYYYKEVLNKLDPKQVLV